MRLGFATGNVGKVREAQAILAPFGIQVEKVNEPVVEIQAEALDVVARAKADALMRRVQPPYFVEDAGLFVDALRGFPGIYSAYAYQTIGCQGILRLLGPSRRRGAAFRAVAVLVESSGRSRSFVGETSGVVTNRLAGRGGFGFDPVFRPTGSRRTFAQMTPEEKSETSHRGQSLRALGKYLQARLRGR